jgi:hypothetical protein
MILPDEKANNLTLPRTPNCANELGWPENADKREVNGLPKKRGALSVYG